MDFEQVIINILVEAGPKGLALNKIARHVHNSVNTLFDEVSYDVVYKNVRNIIYKNSRNSYSLFERTEIRGRYRLNRNSEKLCQQQIIFD